MAGEKRSCVAENEIDGEKPIPTSNKRVVPAIVEPKFDFLANFFRNLRNRVRPLLIEANWHG